MPIYQSVLDMIGYSPLLHLTRLIPPNSGDLFAKIEYLNPSGSIKDRVAKAMIEQAEAKGELSRQQASEQTIIEASSGSMGIAIALVGGQLGYNVKIVVRHGVGKEKIDLMRLFGADVIFSRHEGGILESIQEAEHLASTTPNSVFLNQFENEENWKVNYEKTGAELWEQMGGEVDVLCVGVGSGGTLSGVASFLKSVNSLARIVAVEPIGSVFSGTSSDGCVSQIQGLGNEAIPAIAKTELFDEVIQVSDQDSLRMMRCLAQKEGLMAGIAAGAVAHVSAELASKSAPGTKVATIFTDSLSHYMQSYFEKAK